MMEDWAGKTPTPDQWREIFEAHARWNRGEPDGRRANLSGANLSDANLSRANLSRADLSRANLSRANLSRANLRGSNLSGSNLNGSDLRGSNLRGSDLRGSNLRGSDLSGSDLRGADLSGANEADLVIARTRILPEGALIGWKKCRAGVIVKLRIPEDAKRSHAFGRKCRAEFADVLEVIGAPFGVSQHDGMTKYRAGERVKPDHWDDTWQEECSNGVHFYITRAEAEAHE